MINDGAVESIVALPPQLFHSTAIPVTLWLLRAPVGGSAGHVLFIDARAAGRMISRPRRVLTDDDISQLIGVYQDWRRHPPTVPYRGVDGLARSVPLEEIRQRDYVLNPGRYCMWLHPARVLTSTARPDRPRVAAGTRLAAQLRSRRGRASRPTAEKDRPVETLIGDVPEDWTAVCLGDVCDILAGPSGAFVRGKIHTESGVPVVAPKDLKGNRIVLDGSLLVAPDTAERLRRYRLAAGDIERYSKPA
jgi:type I restriction enzyme M protein